MDWYKLCLVNNICWNESLFCISKPLSLYMSFVQATLRLESCYNVDPSWQNALCIDFNFCVKKCKVYINTYLITLWAFFSCKRSRTELRDLFIPRFTGRTLDFTLEVSRMPIIGLKFLNSDTARSLLAEEKMPAAISAGVSLSRKPSNNQDIDSVWRRPQASQVKQIL